MKLARFQKDSDTFWGMFSQKENMIYTDFAKTKNLGDFAEVIEIFDNAAALDGKVQRTDVKLLAPCLPTKNILCVGKNYYDHVMEFDGNSDDITKIKERPILFSKAQSSVTGPYETVYLHENVCSNVDYEAELAVVIGKRGVNIKKEDALQYVYGYTILNDITARDLQKSHQQWFKGKSLDTHCPIGPWIVTKDDIEDGNNLKITSMINGEVRQNANTSLMMHDIGDLIMWFSAGMTLNPGDVIATGTPQGVGMGFNPPKYLKAGDEVEVTIEKIGSLINWVKSSLD